MSISYNSKKKLLLYTHNLHWEIDKCIHKSQAITFRPDHPKNGLTHLLTSIEFNETSSTSLNGQLLVLQNLLLKVKSFPSYYHHLGLHLVDEPSLQVYKIVLCGAKTWGVVMKFRISGWL